MRIGETLESNRAAFGQGAAWHPVIFAPSIAYLANVARFFDAAWNYRPGNGYPNRAWIRAFAYHPYDANRPNWTFGPLNDRIAASGLPAHMPEYTGLTASLAHRILVNVPETVRIHRFALSGWVVVTGGGTGVELSGSAKLFRNYSSYVRPGAQRKGVSHNAPASFCNGIPWLNRDDRFVVVVHTTAAGTCWIDGLPAGTWGINYGLGTDTNQTSNTNITTVTEWNRELPEVVLSQGSALRVTVAGTGVYTIYQK
jgi:hypothetical protein